MAKKETLAEKKHRHHEEERVLRKRIKGNAPYRAELAKKVVNTFIQTQDVSQHEKDIERLLCHKDNYKGVESEYEKLLTVLSVTSFKEKANKFRAKLK